MQSLPKFCHLTACCLGLKTSFGVHTTDIISDCWFSRKLNKRQPHQICMYLSRVSASPACSCSSDKLPYGQSRGTCKLHSSHDTEKSDTQESLLCYERLTDVVLDLCSHFRYPCYLCCPPRRCLHSHTTITNHDLKTSHINNNLCLTLHFLAIPPWHINKATVPSPTSSTG
jgi:hypothetical protein